MTAEDFGAPLRAKHTGHMNRGRFLSLTGGGLAAVGLSGAGLLGPGRGVLLAQSSSRLDKEIEAAAKEYEVPDDLLLAMGYVNTLWEMPPPSASDYERGDLHGRGDYGIMQLEQSPWRDTLGRAASLTGLAQEQLKNDRAANIKGAAAVLSDIVGQTKPEDLDSWQEAVAAYAGTELYTREVYLTLKNGASLTISTGERVALSPKDVTVPQFYTARAADPSDYPPAVWRPAARSNYTDSNREASYYINKIVVHVAQGSYSSAINTFATPNAYVSAHYVVSRTGAVAQCVQHEDVAYHAGHWPTNTHSIGIEHAGYVGNPAWFTRRMYKASARLAAYCCKRHKIPIDRQHVIGHNQVPGCPGSGGGVSCHTDPGKYWDWNRYIRLIRYFRRRM